jgi:hypothetical protein
MIMKNDYIVAEWGDTRYVDLTASLSKSILPTVAGPAVRKERRVAGTASALARVDSRDDPAGADPRKLRVPLVAHRRSGAAGVEVQPRLRLLHGGRRWLLLLGGPRERPRIVVKNLGATQQTLGEFVDRVMASVRPT